MNPSRVWIAALLLCLSPNLRADPCVTQANTLEMNACAKQQHDAADARLNDAYQSLKAALPAQNEPGVAGPVPRVALRDAHCAMRSGRGSGFGIWIAPPAPNSTQAAPSSR